MNTMTTTTTDTLVRQRAASLLAERYMKCLDFRSDVKLSDFERDLATAATICQFDPDDVVDALGWLDNDATRIATIAAILSAIR